MFGNIKSCLKLLPLPFALPLQLSFRLPLHFKLPVPRAFLYPFNVLSYCLIWLFIPVGSLDILASFFSPFLEILNTWHEFFPLGDFFKHTDVLFGQRRKESINTITLQVFFFLKFLQSFPTSSRGFGVYSISRPCERAIKIHFSRHILSKVILGLFFLLIFFSASGARTVGRRKRNVC